VDFLPYVFGIVGVAVYGAVGQLAGPKSGGLLGAIRGEDGRLSSSKFQFFLWTGVVIFSWVAVYVASHSYPGICIVSSRAEFPSNVLLAMGFSVITLATAKGVTTAYVYAGRLAKGTGASWSLADLVCADDGKTPDLTKIQMLTWTLLAAGSYLYSTASLITLYHYPSGAPSCGIPDIDTALMALMGIGQGAYLGTKIITNQSIILRNLDKPQTFAGDTVTINGSGFGTTQGSVYFGTVAALMAAGAGAWSDAAIKVIVPAIDSSDNQPFSPGDSVSVGVLLTGSDESSSTGNTLLFTYSAPPAATTVPPASQAAAAPNQPATQMQVAASTAAAPISAEAAQRALYAWLDSDTRARVAAEGRPPRAHPLVYRLDQTPTANSPVMSVKGPVHPERPARHVFFVDHNPGANWEHRCSYVFVDDEGGAAAVESTAPPSAKTRIARLPVQYELPEDLRG
jgi:IPT/TIG domain